jgi:chromosome segregation ATPase
VAESVLNQEERKEKAETNKTNPQGSKNKSYKTKRILGIVLMILMIGLTVYVLKLQNENVQLLSQSNDLASTAGVTQASNYRSYVKQYKDTKVQLEETTRKLEAVTQQLNDVTAELNTTKTLLAQTQTMLTQATSENSKLKEDIQGLDGLKATEGAQNVVDLEARVAALKSKNAEAGNELNSLKTQLRAFQADFSTMEEGRSLITLFQNKIRLVKSRMRTIEQQAYFAKIAAQKERDRIASLNGNNGFLFHNGEVKKPNATNKSFSIDVKMVQ